MKIRFMLVTTMCAVASCATIPPAEDLGAYMSTLGGHGFSGAVLVARDGRVVHRSAHGFADRESAIPNTVDTVFDLGSLSKQFTAAAILHLEERGLLSLDDTLPVYFEDVPEDKRAITIHQLLTHTAALPQYVYDGDFVETARDEAVALAMGAPLVGTPGRRYRYSDTGYGLAAAIVEVASGIAFTEYLTRFLFEPAGMVDTGFYNDEMWKSRPVANGYSNGRDVGPVASRPGPYWGILGFGGVVSTVDDLMRWRLALEGDTVLRRETARRMFEPYVQEGSNDSWSGYGWVVWSRSDGETVTGHDGATDSNNSALYYHHGQDILVVALSNAIDRGRGRELFYASTTSEAILESVIRGELHVYPSFVR